MYLKSFILAWRRLTRHASYSLINIVGLSTAMSCCLVIGIFIQYETSFDQRHKKADLIYKVVQETKFDEDIQRWSTTAYPLAKALRDDFTTLTGVTQISGPTSRLFSVKDQTGKPVRYEEDNVLFTDSYFPQTFDLNWLAGDPKTALTKPRSAVLTKSLAFKYFHTQTHDEVLGKQIMLNNKDDLTITGIVEDAAPNSSLKYQMLIPYAFFEQNNAYFASNWSGNYQGTTFVEIKEGESINTLTSRINEWKKKYLKPEANHRIRYRLQPLVDIHLDPTFGETPGSYVMPVKIIYAAGGIGIFMLIIACINFINLATAQAANRAKEVTIRKVIGSSRASLIIQFLSENLIVVGFSLILSVALAQVGLSFINEKLQMIDLKMQLDGYTILGVFVVGSLIILLASLYPAHFTASYQPIEVLKDRINAGTKTGMPLRRLLIVFQFSMVQLLVIGTVIVAAQMNYFKFKDLGFNTDDTVVITKLPVAGHHGTLRQTLLSHSGISEITYASGSPVSDYNFHYGTSFRLPGEPEEKGKGAEMKGVDTAFVDFYKLHLLAGRNFVAVEDGFSEFIVNEKLVQSIGWTPSQAIGRRLQINEGVATIVGVVSDFHNNSLQDEITPCILIHWKSFLETASIKLQPGGDQAEVLSFIEASWKKYYPEWVFDFTFLDDAMAKNYDLQRLVFSGFKSFALLTILIGGLGLYGLLSFITLRKAKEVGVRKVLGASTADLFILLSKEFLILIVISFLIAVPISHFFMEKWLQDFAYRIELAWWIFALGFVITICIAIMTTTYNCLKAAFANPVEALRNE